MITPAQRTSLVNEYYFSIKLKEIDQMNRDGKKVINLGIGSPDMAAPHEAIEAMVNSARTYGTNGYQSYIGIPELRNAFSKWYKHFFRVELDPEKEILPLMGSKEGIMHVSMAFLNPGDKVLVPNPGYPTYSSISLMVGAEIIPYNLKYQNSWEPDFQELENMELSGVKLMWVNYPNMPTGKPASYELYKKLIDFGKKHGILICNDNPYSFILNDNPISILEIEGAKETAIELNSMSKSHNMAGFRIGMVAGESRLISYILQVKSNMDSGMYKPLQMAAAQALSCNEDWFNRINDEYKRRRELVWQIFEATGSTYDKRQSGLFVWAKIPQDYDNSSNFSNKYLYESSVFIAPGFIFGTNGEGFARISLCCNIETLNEALNRIKKNKN
ncbi:MAG: aminotransferase class I/II-fold pyridoxal phosphate-dependent enzyme [Bacteroidales bacterium]|jgi:LL-diaminopimelate aminotransferase|nr:aminotransferase class I/II-fold pyridoxal phosphate-dependent enzyme [Bacteroidales bacterium]